MKISVIATLILAYLATGCALVVNKQQIHANTAVEFPPKEELKIGVLPLLAPTSGGAHYAGYWGGDGTIRTLENSGQIVADAITAALLDVHNFTLIERAQLAHILGEHELTMTGIVDQPDLEVLEQILPVDALVFGTVSAFYNWNEAGNWGSIVAFNARLVDVHSGQILFAISGAANEHNGAPDEMVYSLARGAIKKVLR
jgi:curli biogenesis system outer membrane secretion channel CsgG